MLESVVTKRVNSLLVFDSLFRVPCLHWVVFLDARSSCAVKTLRPKGFLEERCLHASPL